MVTDHVEYKVGGVLPDEVLSRRQTLPMKPNSVSLKGEYITLAPLEIGRDVQPLYQLSNGSAIHVGDRYFDEYDPDILIWRYMADGPFADEQQFSKFLQSQVEANNGSCLCVFDNATAKPVGVCNYMNNFPAHLKIELGSIWYSPIVQRTKVNLEATYLLLKHAFSLGYRRVEWKCDSLNERSRRAAIRMGFKFEGIQEQHLIVKGRNRDTAWFRMMDHEWPRAKMSLEQMLHL
jgi:RimJ/RimL family protein N-acetyltransferase